MFSLQPSVGQNIARIDSRNVAILIFALAVHSFSFSPFNSYAKSELDFYL